MEVKQVDGSKIRRMTAQGIWYEDDAGAEQFIDFVACYETYAQRRPSPESWVSYKELNHKSDADWEDHVERIRQYKEVGARNVLESEGGPFIEFYITPRIRFRFTDQDAYWKARKHVERSGYRVFDLT